MTDRAIADALALLPIDYPEVPSMTAIVAGLGTPAVQQSRSSLRWALAAVIVAAVALVTLVAPVRQAVADWLGIGAIRIVDVGEIPTGLPDSIAELGEPVPVDTVTACASVLGCPDQAFASTDPDALSLVWLPRRGLAEVGSSGVGALLTRFEGTLDNPIIEKSVGEGARVVVVAVGEARGYWIEGEAHAFGYLDREGEIVFETLRLAGNTLLWEADEVAYRFESGLDMTAAIDVAEAFGRQGLP
jgi:hypothetical protein